MLVYLMSLYRNLFNGYSKSNTLLDDTDHNKIQVNFIMIKPIYAHFNIRILINDLDDIPSYYKENDTYVLCLDTTYNMKSLSDQYDFNYDIIETKEITSKEYNSLYSVYKSYKPNQKYCIVNTAYLETMIRNKMPVLF